MSLVSIISLVVALFRVAVRVLQVHSLVRQHCSNVLKLLEIAVVDTDISPT